MNYYWFNREELLQKCEGKYHNCSGKEKAAKYYIAIEDVLKEKTRNKDGNLSQKEKEAKSQYSKDRYKKINEKLRGKL